MPKKPTTPSRLSFYGVAVALGLAFATTLFMYAWQNAIDEARRNFAFEAVTVRSTLDRNVRASDTALGSLAAYFAAVETLSRHSFTSFAESVLTRNDFLDTVAYYEYSHGPGTAPRGAGAYVDAGEALSLTYQVPRRARDRLPADHVLNTIPGFDEALRMATETGAAYPAPPFRDGPFAGRYLVIKTVSLRSAGDPRAVTGVVTALVDPQRLFGAAMLERQVGVTLTTESQGVSGRQLLLRRQPQASGWVLTELSEEAQIQLPHYSMRLVLEKPVLWGDLDQALLLTAAVLGLGITLLIIALAHAREQQERELRARNAEIERQVQRQTKELAEARDQALEASRVKSDFLASMSHEIRTPLNAIIGMAELLSETRLSNDQERYVGVFRKAGEALLNLVNDILDLSKIEAGQLILEAIEFDLREVIEHAVELYALKCNEKGIELLARIDPRIPAHLIGDPSRLRQIILNLIGNAIKFTEAGEIVVQVEPADGPAGEDTLRFSVSDTGIGIPAKKLESIFASFTQVDSSTTRKYGGTGLGLTISKRLVEMMGGRIWVESEEGKGSTFRFEVPLQAAPVQAPQRAASPVQLAGMKVLVIDDNATNRLILEEVLASHGARVTSANDGAAGLAAFEQARAAGEEFELVLTDCQMPAMDGFELAQAIKSAGGRVNTVMMLTSQNLSADLDRVHAIGIGAYLVKPVKWADLFAAINATLGQQRAPAAAPEEQAAAAEGRADAILLVEDTDDNRLLIKAYLKKAPYRIDEAENGAIAVEMFKQRDYGLVLMDVQMPVMDGHQATREIRAWEAEQGRAPTPIIALTAHAIKEDMDKSLAAGCTAHLTKPIKKATLLQAIEQYLTVPA